VNVALETGSANATLALGEFRGSGQRVYAATLGVTSGSYRAHLRFNFDDAVFVAFVDALLQMDTELHGKARLRELGSQEPYLALEIIPTGAVVVSGVLLDWEHGVQRMEFHFDTVHAVLRPFAEGLAKARALQIAAQSGSD
jgi:hypothetical protein